MTERTRGMLSLIKLFDSTASGVTPRPALMDLFSVFVHILLLIVVIISLKCNYTLCNTVSSGTLCNNGFDK